MTNLSGDPFIKFHAFARKFGTVEPKPDVFQIFFEFLRLILFFVFYLSNNIDDENCPQTIEYKYALASVPDGFEMIETDSSTMDVYTLYRNKQTEQEITFHQIVKSYYNPHVNTEHYQMEEITINGKTGLYVYSCDEGYLNLSSALILDNEDYILEIVADFNKSEMLKLANFNKA